MFWCTCSPLRCGEGLGVRYLKAEGLGVRYLKAREGLGVRCFQPVGEVLENDT
jgi:hypothetical protein